MKSNKPCRELARGSGWAGNHVPVRSILGLATLSLAMHRAMNTLQSLPISVAWRGSPARAAAAYRDDTLPIGSVPGARAQAERQHRSYPYLRVNSRLVMHVASA